MRRWLAHLCLLGALVGLTFSLGGHEDHSAHAMPSAQSTAPECQVLPLGAVAPAPPPIWCVQLGPDEPTFVNGANAWEDDFNHGASLAQLGTGYVEGFRGDGRGLHWRHSNHWMVDLQAQTGQYPTLLAAFMRPDRTFRPVNGTVVIEMEVAVPIAGTRDIEAISDSWPELVLSTASTPTTTNPWGSWLRQNGTYLYEGFPHDWTFGCRMQQSRHPICSLYRPNTPGTPNYAGGPDRIWEINQNGGQVTSQFGGDPSVGNLSTLWASCATNQDPDTVCRNLFRFELQANHLKILVKKPGASQFALYYEAGLIDSNLGNILNAPNGFYVFFGDFAYRIENGAVIRFHWDRLAVNPEAMGGQPPTPTSTPAPAVTPTPTPTAMPTSTTTATPTQTPAVVTWTIGARTPVSVVAGQPIQIMAQAQPNGAISALVDVEVYGPTGQKVFQRFADNQTFAANEVKGYTYDMPTAGLPVGTYTVKVGVFKAGWGQLYAWADRAATFQVRAP